MGARASRLAPPTRIDGFELVRFIAEGATSDVYEARDLSSGERVAIKLLHDSGWADDDDPVARFESEVRLAMRLDSPYLVRVLGSGRAGRNRPFMVMELLGGSTLKERLSEIGRVSIDAALELGRQLFLALDAMHVAGVVHRDVKPRNIVLHTETARPCMKLVDFGISDLIGGTWSESEANSQYAMGTPAYMSPEQLAGTPVDQRVDIYSAGVVLYEMICGRRPFDGPDLDWLTRAILFEPVLPPSLLRPSCPPALEELVLRCLERNPQRRPHTARTVAEALHAIAVATRREAGVRAWLTLPSAPPPGRHSAANGQTLKLPRERASA
jgi:eukaryotic-like serine/threonine-protein kinase